jgi:hypothetical protein
VEVGDTDADTTVLRADTEVAVGSSGAPPHPASNNATKVKLNTRWISVRSLITSLLPSLTAATTNHKFSKWH